MFLANPVEIREALGFDEMADIDNAIRSCLKSATSILSARLGSPFDAGEFVDRYYVNAPGFRDGGSVQTEFRLSRGFVQEITGAGWSDSMTVLGMRPVPLLEYMIMDQRDREIGRVRDYTTPYGRSYVSIAYKAGFPVSKFDDETYDLDVVPGWLQEAAKMRALILLNGNAALEQATIKIDTKTLGEELNAILAEKKRYTPVAMLPL
jgi:hypothetical protein